MGFRTVVMLNNDTSHEWSKDPKLGEKIQTAMSRHGRGNDRYEDEVGNYGRVVEVVHADQFTLAALGAYTLFKPIGNSFYNSYNRDDGMVGQFNATDLALVKDAADRLGYRLVKKSK
jgi:hypothetical protein